MITLTDGTQTEYHASFNFPQNVYMKMKQEDCNRLKRERASSYNSNRRNNRNSEIQELCSQIQDLRQATRFIVPLDDMTSTCSQVSQITTGTTIMGGRNEQAKIRESRQTTAVFTKPYVQTTVAKHWTDPPANTKADNKCNTNADTCCLGRNFVALHTTY
jgi:hypothetical protein